MFIKFLTKFLSTANIRKFPHFFPSQKCRKRTHFVFFLESSGSSWILSLQCFAFVCLFVCLFCLLCCSTVSNIILIFFNKENIDRKKGNLGSKRLIVYLNFVYLMFSFITKFIFSVQNHGYILLEMGAYFVAWS